MTLKEEVKMLREKVKDLEEIAKLKARIVELESKNNPWWQITQPYPTFPQNPYITITSSNTTDFVGETN